jgi:hypothetical protein
MNDFDATFTRYENGIRYVSAPLRLRAESFDAAYHQATIFLSGMKAGALANVELMELRDTGINLNHPSTVVSTDLLDIWQDPRPPVEEKD